MRAGAAAIKAAIIDLDGTMLDTVPDFEAALNGMRAEFGLGPITQATIKPMVGKGSEKLVRDALLLDWDAARVDAIHADAMAAYQRHYLAINGDSFAKKKPDPMPMLGACAALDLSPSQVVAIGDSSNDAESARAAGCYVLTVPYGYNHGRPIQEINSDGIVGSLLDAATLIIAHNRAAN